MSQRVYAAVTARIVDALGRGLVPWRKPWAESRPPENAVSHKPYRGVNVFLLGLGLFKDHRWLTFKQAQDMGGHVRCGERSMLAVFWKLNELATEDEADRKRSVPILRYYHVFNVEQCDGLRLPALAAPDQLAPRVRIERAEQLVRSLPDPPTIRERCSEAWYRPSEDLIQIPRLQDFSSSDAFYATLFHELGHATGHEKRLNRPGVTGTIHFGSEDYSREELVAELTSAYCCASLGLDNSLVDNSAAYIDGWLRRIGSDPKTIVMAATQAQRAADYLRGTDSAEG